MKKNEITVTIFGSDYRVIVEDLDIERIKKIAEVVDKKMREIHREFPLPSTTKIAVVACLNLVDEYLQRELELNKKIADMKQKISALSIKIDEAIS